MTKAFSILVVDDDPLVRLAIVRTLKRISRASVTDFGDGEEALKATEDLHVDLAILDLKMPYMDGVEVGRALRAKRPELHLVFVSADPHGELGRRAMALSPLALLGKPWTVEELLQLLRPLHVE